MIQESRAQETDFYVHQMYCCCVTLQYCDAYRTDRMSFVTAFIIEVEFSYIHYSLSVTIPICNKQEILFACVLVHFLAFFETFDTFSRNLCRAAVFLIGPVCLVCLVWALSHWVNLGKVFQLIVHSQTSCVNSRIRAKLYNQSSNSVSQWIKQDWNGSLIPKTPFVETTLSYA